LKRKSWLYRTHPQPFRHLEIGWPSGQRHGRFLQFHQSGFSVSNAVIPDSLSAFFAISILVQIAGCHHQWQMTAIPIPYLLKS